MTFDLMRKRVWVAGERGMVGSALIRRLERENCEIVTVPGTRVDLRDQQKVKLLVEETKPNLIFLAAAKVGGILANDRFPGDFLYDNLMIEFNVINSALAAEVGKLVFLGSSCIYPKYASQPIDEDALLTGSLEPTNQWYALAKIAGVKLCQAYRRQHGADFISAMPTNLYGPGDNFDLETSHVIPALMRKAHEAKISGSSAITIWGPARRGASFCMSMIVRMRLSISRDFTRTKVRSMSVAAKTSPSLTLPSSLRTSSVSRGGLCAIRRSRTERRERC